VSRPLPAGARDRAIEATTAHWWGDIGPLEARALAARAVDGLLAQPEVLRALAGVPTADVAAAQWCNCQAPSRLEGPWHPLGDMPFCPRPAAPEGVDAADQQTTCSCPYGEPCRGADCGDEGCRNYPFRDCSAPTHEPDGMDVEAQGEMADELTAAQAAIQRVRDLHRQHVLTAPDHDPYCEVCSYEDGWPCPTVRALDGDTTEEAP
jgi:hypothetical protein